jgi:hypothetical protein
MSELQNNVNENNEQILNNIQTLQQMEQQLFNNLESNVNLTPDQQKKIIDKINQLSNMRINLYKTLSNVNSYYKSTLNTSIDSLMQQRIAIRIIENELNRSKNRMELLQEITNNKLRLVEINTYFGDKYAEHSELMKIIIYMLVPVIIISFLFNKGILPKTLYYILIIIIAIIGGYFFWKRFGSIIMRDNMNYQEYNWPFNPNNISDDAKLDNSDPWNTNDDMNIGTCIGNSCCAEGLIYDEDIDQCVIDSNKNVESMTVNNILSKKQDGKYKTDYNLSEPLAFNQ